MKVTINADDFGWSHSCVDAIIQSFVSGYIDTTTLIVNGNGFEEAIDRISESEFSSSVGIHFNLTEGLPLTESIRRDRFFCDENGLFHGQVNRYSYLLPSKQKVIYNELNAQLVRFFDTGLSCNHADSHHHIHTAPFITPIVCEVIKPFQISKLRIHRNIGKIHPFRRLLKNYFNRYLLNSEIAYSNYLGSFSDILDVPEVMGHQGLLEIMCHPDYTNEGCLVDRAGDADYTNPYGISLSELVMMVGKDNT